MRTLFSRRRLVIAAAVIFFAAILGWFIFSSPSSSALTISYAHITDGEPHVAVIGLTNCSLHVVFLEAVKVQTLQNGIWSNCVAPLYIQYIGGDGNWRVGDSGAFLRPNDFQTLRMNGLPEARSWRIYLQYSEQRSGLGAFLVKLRLAIAQHKLTLPNVTLFSRNHTLFSAPITNAPAAVP